MKDNSLGKRIKEARGSLNQDEFARAIGVSVISLSRYEHDEKMPDAAVLARICETYAIDPCWLLMNEDAAKSNLAMPGSRPGMAETARDATLRAKAQSEAFRITSNEFILMMMTAKGKTQTELAAEIGIRQQCVSRWFTGKASLSKDTKRRICQALGVSGDFAILNDYPFGKDSFQKLFISNRETKASHTLHGMSLFHAILSLNRKPRVIYLSVETAEIREFKKSNPYGELYYTILVKDDYDNVILLRRRDPKEFITYSMDPRDTFGPLLEAARQGRGATDAVNVAIMPADQVLYTKLRMDWDGVKRTDVNDFFDKAKFTEVVEITESDREIIRTLRQMNMSPLTRSELIMIEEIRRNKIHPFDIIKELEKNAQRKPS